MKILHIVAGNLNGGAARGAYWLHQALVELGVDSRILTNSVARITDERIYYTTSTKKGKLLSWIRAQIDSDIQLIYPKRKRVIFSTGLVGFDFTKTNLYKESDVIHLHWINAGFVNIKHLSRINKPIVWTLRDMWPMTGGCHYTTGAGCENFKFGCGNCKQLGSNIKYDLSRYIMYRKKKYLPKHIKIVGISPWISEEAKKSELFKEFDIRYIFNNVNSNEFYPVEKEIAKKVLGIKSEKKIILVGAQSLSDFYKGFDKFLEAIKKLDNNKNLLCFFGNLNKNVVNNLSFEYKNFGFLYDIISLRLVYSCADVFVAPSLMDAFGKTIAESMACGTPVVCFNATGPANLVDHMINGYKAEPFDTTDLANGIEWVLNTPNYYELCKSAREKVVREFDSKVVAKRYIELYEEILGIRF